MANIKVDTKRLKSDGKRIVELSKQYKVLIDDLFEKINNTVRNNWSGVSSINYQNNLRIEKEFFLKFQTHINCYGTELINHANSIENIIKNWVEK